MSDKNRSHTGISINEQSIMPDAIDEDKQESEDDDSEEFRPDAKESRRKNSDQDENMGGLFGIGL